MKRIELKDQLHLPHIEDSALLPPWSTRTAAVVAATLAMLRLVARGRRDGTGVGIPVRSSSLLGQLVQEL